MVVVTEHQMITRACRCGARPTRVAPVGVQAPVPFGPRVTAVLAYLHHSQLSHVRPEPDTRAPLHRLGTVPAAISGRQVPPAAADCTHCHRGGVVELEAVA